MAKPEIVEELDLELTSTTDWYHEELPTPETEDVGVDPEDLQSWITTEYSMISLLDEVLEDINQLRTHTKSRVDIMVKLTATVERLQQELLSDEDDELDAMLAQLTGGEE